MEITRNILWFVSLLLIAGTVLGNDEEDLKRLPLREKKKVMRKDIEQSLTIILGIIGCLMLFSLCCFFFNWSKVKSDYMKRKFKEKEALEEEEAEEAARLAAENAGEDGGEQEEAGKQDDTGNGESSVKIKGSSVAPDNGDWKDS